MKQSLPPLPVTVADEEVGAALLSDDDRVKLLFLNGLWPTQPGKEVAAVEGSQTLQTGIKRTAFSLGYKVALGPWSS